ncbi:MAG: ATP-binding cassette domain-containing protein [Actinomycetota bacterium]
MTVILVTHDSRAEQYADRIVRIQDGRISAQWSPDGEEHPVIDPLGWMQIPQSDAPTLSKSSPIESTAEPRSSLIRASHLTLKYSEREIFSNISIEASPKEFIAITGPSGTGKSSLLRILSGIQEPSEGSVFIEDQELSLLSRESRSLLRSKSLSFLMQGNSPVSSISVRDYFPEMTDQLLGAFATRLNRRLSSFSGGERARIEIFKLLSDNRKTLILDEPTSQLDDKRSGEIAQLLVNHVEQGGLVIASTRDEQLLACATKVISLGS